MKIKFIMSGVLTFNLLTSGLVFGLDGMTNNTSPKEPDYIGHWGETQIRDFINEGIVKGYEDGNFKPDREVTRAEFITMVNKAFGLTEKKEISFKDVPANAWYADELKKAVAAGYIKGYSDGTAKPDKLVTKIETAKIIADLLKINLEEKPEVLKDYKDSNSVPEWGKKQFCCMISDNYYKASIDNWILPYKNVTRAETVTLLYKAKGGTIDDAKIPVQSAEKELTGVLYSTCCKNKPKETKKCLLMPGCEAKGYGVNVKNKDGSTTYYKFDENGHKLAKELIENTATEENIKILLKCVEGALPDVIKVLSISEESSTSQDKETTVPENNNNVTNETLFIKGTEKVVNITGMTCEMCVKHIRSSLEKIEGLDVLDVSIGKAKIKFSKDINESIIKEAVKNAGYSVDSIE